MKKYVYFTLVISFFSLISIRFESQFINPNITDYYSIWYQPFIILGPMNSLQELMKIIVLLGAFTMFFIGDIKRGLYERGIYEIARFKNKSKWLRIKLLILSKKLILLVSIYIIISVSFSYFLVDSSLEIASINIFLSQALIFYFSLLALLQIQATLELYLIETIANAVVLISAFIIVNIYPLISNSFLLKNIFFINNISIVRSSVFSNQAVYTILFLMGLNAFIYLINTILISRKDIY